MKRSDMIPTQPIFSNMISGCIQANQIDRAWEVFDSMRLSYHQPDEVSFTLMLQACAKMQTVYGFQPDLITYNTLLSACARKGHLERARDIFKTVDQHMLPDTHTYTNLFRSYANYNPLQVNTKQQHEDQEGLVAHSLMSNDLPERRSAVVLEASKIFNAIVADRRCEITTALLNAYLSVHVMQKQVRDCIDIYHTTFNAHKVERNPRTFSHMLQFSYNQRDADLAWRVWGDYQDFLEGRQQQDVPVATQIQEGWAPNQQRELALLMVNTLAR
ncbi:hypothetical protein BJV82DRAFT_523025 [Fennellomyces sp. T-0311]|nr:hypothetical protein BJV82DRAFT_523025 [Fennellomyces sp. T-0311]